MCYQHTIYSHAMPSIRYLNLISYLCKLAHCLPCPMPHPQCMCKPAEWLPNQQYDRRGNKVCAHLSHTAWCKRIHHCHLPCMSLFPPVVQVEPSPYRGQLQQMEMKKCISWERPEAATATKQEPTNFGSTFLINAASDAQSWSLGSEISQINGHSIFTVWEGNDKASWYLP